MTRREVVMTSFHIVKFERRLGHPFYLRAVSGQGDVKYTTRLDEARLFETLGAAASAALFVGGQVGRVLVDPAGIAPSVLVPLDNSSEPPVTYYSKEFSPKSEWKPEKQKAAAASAYSGAVPANLFRRG